ncbi:MAG: tetratricopeptide repeat protein [Acidobacteria bacterium]|nr:tetratricopeptide repeat protein [Acidobacteriota bacterium]
MKHTCQLLLALAIVGVAPVSAARHGDEAALYAAIRELGLDPEAIAEPLRMNDAMREWLAAEIPPGLPVSLKMQRLLHRLLLPDGLGLHYEVGFTGTAQEVFTAAAGNCLGFTQMFVAMGRELGFDIYYLAVDELTRFRRESDLIIVSDHVTAAFNEGPKRRILEFSLGPDYDYRTAREVNDLEGLALYYSNRGAELVQERDFRRAQGQLEIAVKLAPGLAQAWVNLGVARRRRGDLAGAEADYRRAIEEDKDQLSAYHNLAGLYRLQGREDPAGEILSILTSRKNRNPFVFLQLGDMILHQTRVAEAERFYRRAVRLGREHAETHAAYGLWYLDSGETQQARRQLKRAERRDRHERRTVELRERLAELELARAPAG